MSTEVPWKKHRANKVELTVRAALSYDPKHQSAGGRHQHKLPSSVAMMPIRVGSC